MSSAIRITRDNMIENVAIVRRGLESGLSDADELRRLLDEALHVIVRQEESRRVARRFALEAAVAAASPIMPKD